MLTLNRSFRDSEPGMEKFLCSPVPWKDISPPELYRRIQIRRGHGLPLCNPKNLMLSPSEGYMHEIIPRTMQMGEITPRTVQIGDVGIARKDGSFDRLFNICAAQDDAINLLGAPSCFETVLSQEVQYHPRYHRSGTDICSSHIRKKSIARL